MNFLTFFETVANNGLIFGILGIGVFITFRILDFADLTVDGSFTLGGAVFSILAINGMSFPLAMILAILAGAAAGLITALLHCYLGIPGILAGILTQLMLYSLNLVIMGGSNLSTPSRGSLISSSEPALSIAIFAVFAVCLIGLLYWFFGTKFGSSIRAVGSNEQMSKANGINVKTRKITALMVSNAIVALSGALFSRYMGLADVKNGTGKIVIALAAIIIGGAIVKKWGKNFALQLLFVVVGGFIYSLVYQIVGLVLKNQDLLKMISAIVVAIFIAIPYIKSHYFEGFLAKRNRSKEKEAE